MIIHLRTSEMFDQQAFGPIAGEHGDGVYEKAREYALNRLSFSPVLQVCGRGIRHERDRCVFVLLDRRYDDHGWRRFLEPKPYNLLRQPERAVHGFRRTVADGASRKWDEALVQAIE